MKIKIRNVQNVKRHKLWKTLTMERRYVKNAVNINNSIEKTHREELRQKERERYEQYKEKTLDTERNC